MARCTAPREGHRSARAAANCPECSSRYGRGGGYGSYSAPSYSPPQYSSPGSSSSSRSSGGFGSGRPRWSRIGSSVIYTPVEIRALTPIRETVEKQASRPVPDFRDVFLCHAWDDRREAAKELYDLLVSRGVSVWFSERDIGLGTPFLREIDKGLAKSRVGVVLVTPALLVRLRQESIADKELSVLLAREQLVPVVHNTTYDDLRDVSPMLGSRNGLSTAEDPMGTVATKIAELVTV